MTETVQSRRDSGGFRAGHSATAVQPQHVALTVAHMRRPFTRLLILLLFVAGCGTGASETELVFESQTAPPSATPPVPARSGHQSTSDAPTPTEAADAPILTAGGFAEVVTTDLVVRSAPGVGADSEIYGTIEHIPAYIVAGPVDADGYEWWLVAHEQFDRLGGPPAGWVAAAGKDGEVWLAPTRPDCPPAPTGGEWFVPGMWVSCYTGLELTLEGVLGGCAAALAPLWDNSCSLYPCPHDLSPAECLDGFDLQSVFLHFDSAPSQDRGRITVTGHFDDPNASACSVVGSPLADLAVFECRRHFVVTSYEFDG